MKKLNLSNITSPKCYENLDKSKYDFMFKRTIFRKMSEFYKNKFQIFTNMKKIPSNKIQEKTENFFNEFFIKYLPFLKNE